MFRTTHRSFLAAAFLTALFGSSASALEGGQSPYLKGFQDFMSGYLPPQEGVYNRTNIYAYSGSLDKTVLQGRVRAELDLRIYSALPVMTVVTPTTFLGGQYAFGASWGVVDANLKGKLETTRLDVSREAGASGLSDLILIPAMFGWHHGNFHWTVGLTVYAPFGSYNDDKVINTGMNFATVQPQASFTYFDPKVGIDLSVAVAYLVNQKNYATDYRSGDVLHIDAAAGYQINEMLKLGVVGYAMHQVTGDSGSGAKLGPYKSSVYGVGPAAVLTFNVASAPVQLIAKYYKEFSATNTTEGDAGTIAMSFKF